MATIAQTFVTRYVIERDEQGVRSVLQGFDRIDKAIDETVNRVGKVAAVGVAAFTGMGIAATNAASDAETGWAKMAAATGRDVRQLKRDYADFARDVSVQYGLSFGEVQLGIQRTISGLPLKATINDVKELTRVSAIYAQAGLATDMQTAATGLTTVGTLWGMTGDMGTVADMLATASQLSDLQPHELVGLVKQEGSATAAGGTRLDDALALFALFGQTATQSKAGIMGRQLAQAFAGATSRQSTRLRKAGLDPVAMGSLLKEGDIPGLIEMVEARLPAVGDPARPEALGKIFSTVDAQAAYAQLVANLEQYLALRERIRKGGTLDVVAAQMAETPEAAFNSMRRSVDSVIRQIGSNFLPLMRDVSAAGAAFAGYLQDGELNLTGMTREAGGMAVLMQGVAESVFAITDALGITDAGDMPAEKVADIIGAGATGSAALVGGVAAYKVGGKAMSMLRGGAGLARFAGLGGGLLAVTIAAWGVVAAFDVLKERAEAEAVARQGTAGMTPLEAYQSMERQNEQFDANYRVRGENMPALRARLTNALRSRREAKALVEQDPNVTNQQNYAYWVAQVEQLEEMTNPNFMQEERMDRQARERAMQDLIEAHPSVRAYAVGRASGAMAPWQVSDSSLVGGAATATGTTVNIGDQHVTTTVNVAGNADDSTVRAVGAAAADGAERSNQEMYFQLSNDSISGVKD